MKNRTIPVIVVAALASCSGSSGQYPRLLPTAQMLAEPPLPSHAAIDAETAEAGISARATALRERAAELRGPVIEADSPVWQHRPSRR